MRFRFCFRQLAKLATMSAAGVVFQAGGCSLQTDELGLTLASAFSGLLINSIVGNFFGLAGGFGF